MKQARHGEALTVEDIVADHFRVPTEAGHNSPLLSMPPPQTFALRWVTARIVETVSCRKLFIIIFLVRLPDIICSRIERIYFVGSRP
ncbi:MAG: hypothetical protein JWM99_576 [Verrucomicrobiales bacterium]|nr:hypothetical protein [Verrucomicrobiales bacterium]